MENGELGALLKAAEARLQCGDLNGAARAAEEAGDLALDAEGVEPKRRLSRILAGLGDLRLASGQPPAALESYAAALSLIDAVVEGAGETPPDLRERAFLRYRIGTAELAAGRREAALTRFERGAAEIAALCAAQPDHPGLRRDLSASRSMLGDALTEAGRHEPALEQYSEALALAEEVDGAGSDSAPAQAYMATLHRRRAALQEKLGRSVEAVLSLQTQAGILESFRRAGAADAAMIRELIEAYRRLARLAPGEARGPLAAALEAAESLPPPGDPALAAQLRRSLQATGG